jgi:glycogen synthase
LAKLLAAKAEARAALLATRKWRATGRQPVVALVTHRADPELLAELRMACAELALQVVECAEPTAAELLPADIALFPSTDLATSTLAARALTTGTVPVVLESIAPKSVAVEYDPRTEQGNSFYSQRDTRYALFAALVRALETYRFPHDWQALVRSALTIANS